MTGKVVVTGVAGFIGSHLARRLIADGHDVAGIDCFTPYYESALKLRNLRALDGSPRFRSHHLDLRTADLAPILRDARHVVHLAGQPGVRASWTELRSCMDHNVVALGNLLDQCRQHHLDRIVLASSSSIYGNTPHEPAQETQPPAPISPYGISKAAAEALATLHAHTFDLPVVILRYFSVYGPRQRPDMLIARLIASALGGPTVPILGDGRAARDFTYVADVVDATLAALTAPVDPATVLNIASGQPVTVDRVIATVADVVDTWPAVQYTHRAHGDVERTSACIATARRLLGWQPATTLVAGIAAQADAQRADLHEFVTKAGAR